MTSEEAIKYLKKMKDECNDKFHKVRYVTREEALDMAIKALEQEPKETWSIKDVATTFERHGLMTEQEPCEDAVDRQVVKEQMSKYGFHAPDMTVTEFVEDLPTVNPQPKWIPVSERLPEAGEYIGDVAKYYLVQNEYGDMLVARYTHSEYWEQMYQLKPIITDEIVAWMPLPKPYKAESEGKE